MQKYADMSNVFTMPQPSRHMFPGTGEGPFATIQSGPCDFQKIKKLMLMPDWKRLFQNKVDARLFARCLSLQKNLSFKKQEFRLW